MPGIPDGVRGPKSRPRVVLHLADLTERQSADRSAESATGSRSTAPASAPVIQPPILSVQRELPAAEVLQQVADEQAPDGDGPLPADFIQVNTSAEASARSNRLGHLLTALKQPRTLTLLIVAACTSVAVLLWVTRPETEGAAGNHLATRSKAPRFKAGAEKTVGNSSPGASAKVQDHDATEIEPLVSDEVHASDVSPGDKLAEPPARRFRGSDESTAGPSLAGDENKVSGSHSERKPYYTTRVAARPRDSVADSRVPIARIQGVVPIQSTDTGASE